LWLEEDINRLLAYRRCISSSGHRGKKFPDPRLMMSYPWLCLGVVAVGHRFAVEIPENEKSIGRLTV
jgi:hypothetical protein